MAKTPRNKKRKTIADGLPTRPREGREQDTAQKQANFLAEYARTGRVDLAAKAGPVHYTTPFDWLKTDPEFKAQWEEARVIAAHVLEDTAWRRARIGYRKPIYYRGELVGHERVPSDMLLMQLLKGHRPDRFRDRATIESTGKDGGPQQHEITGKDGGPMQHVALTPEMAEAIRRDLLGVYIEDDEKEGGSK